MLIAPPPAPPAPSPPQEPVPKDLSPTEPPPPPPPPPALLLDTLARLRARLELPLEAAKDPVDQQLRADESDLESEQRVVLGNLNLVAKLPVQGIEAAIALGTAPLGAACEFPAATLGTPHFALPHRHLRPLPFPLPSIGVLLFGGVRSLLIHGLPAARAGDLGLAPTCGGLTPFFQVGSGSSKVFFSTARAARALDMTNVCRKASDLRSWDIFIPRVDAALNAATAFGKSRTAALASAQAAAMAREEPDEALAAGLAATSAAQALAAGVSAEQGAAATAALAISLVMGRDPAKPDAIPGVLASVNFDVMIGGFPLPPTLSYGLGLFKKRLDAVRKIPLFLLYAGGAYLYSERIKERVPRSLRVHTGHPVDVIRGSLVFDACDLELPGALPLRFTRSYSTTWCARPSPLGHGWSHNFDEAVWLEPRHLVYRAEDGRELELPRLHIGAPATHDLTHRLTLRRPGEAHWQICDHHGITRIFAPIPGDPRPGLSRLTTLHDRRGHTLSLNYDERARLIRVHADDGREIRLHHHADGHLAQIDLPDPDADAFIPHVRYRYHGDDLSEIHDALGQVTRHRHRDHLVVEEQLPGGMRFHFEYDGEGSDAVCIRTHGDGGVLDHRLIYDRLHRTTVVINSCNESTVYLADPRGLITEIRDPRGAITRFEHDEHLRLTATTDALGHTTRHEYDLRGNCILTEDPDGAVETTTYHPELDLPLTRTDRAGGRWQRSYDPQGRITRHTDPLGRSTVLLHDMSPGTGHTETILHPDGRSERRSHDAAGRLVHHLRSDGATHTHHHDRRGRLRRSVDDRGRGETREYDLLGRLTRHCLPDGELRLYTHDARGRIIRACAGELDLRCSYTGLGWLTTCAEADRPPITLERDLEGRIVRVAGPAGTLLRLERDPAGKVRGTIDALGVQRRLTRDLLGRVIELRRPAGQRTRFTRDPAGRITAVDHGDGVRDRFTHRPDGALLTAERTDADGLVTRVRRELDLLGRLVREHQDEHAVALEYDLADRLVRLRSSLGADLRLVHDDRGLARIELPHEPWALSFERDRDGHEQARHLPGEVLSWWHTDRHGRPSEHGIVASRPPQIHRQRRYTWTGTRLEHIAETTRRRPRPKLPEARSHQPIDTHLDLEGRRTTSNLSDGTSCSLHWSGAGELRRATPSAGPAIEYRHDALGRRIARTRGNHETRWLWHGDVPLHRWCRYRPGEVETWVFEPGRFAPLARLTATARHAIVGDHLGTPLAAFDERGQLAWSAEHDPAGQPRPVRGPPDLCPFRFPGQICDPDTGLAYNRFRDYDPDTGRYLTPDPLGLIGGLDLHAYVADPRTQTDVFGLSTDLSPGVHPVIAAELVHDLPAHDLAPALAEVARGLARGLPGERQRLLTTLYQSPPPDPCT